MKNVVSVLVFFTLFVFCANGQKSVKVKIGPLLEVYLDRNENANGQIELFVHGGPEVVRAFTKDRGGIYKRSVGSVSAVRLPISAVRDLAALQEVDGFEFSLSPGHALNDSMRVNNYVVQVHNGNAPLQFPFKGDNVVVGIIDTGIELDHPDFQDANGNTRVMKLWDQTFPFDAQLTPAAYGYGQAWDSTMINAGQSAHVDQQGYFGHGSTVTGTAAGNGLATGAYGGVAPNADLIIVSNKLNAVNWYATVVDAVEWIFNEADELGKPCVINISLGDYFGSHDGLDAAALMIDDLLDQHSGRAVVCAAGNSGGVPSYHLRTDLANDTHFTWFEHLSNTPLGYAAAWFELWADTADLNNVQFAVGADKVSPYYSHRGSTSFFNIQDALNSNLRDSIWGDNGDLIGPVEWFAQLRGGQYQMRVIVKQPDSSAYNFRFTTTGTGAFDVWSHGIFGTSTMTTSLPDPSELPDIVQYVLPDQEQSIVDSWACSPKVITVANYAGEVEYIDYNGNLQSVNGTENDISGASSSGPTRDGRTKPDIAATGDVTMSTGPLDFLQTLIANEPYKVAPGGFHFRGGGTSIASPVVTGAVALYFEKCNLAYYHEVKDAILDNADSDFYTGNVPNNTWGAGKINVFNALVSSNYNTELSVFGDTELCDGDSVLVSGQNFMLAYNWSNGDTLKVIYLSDAGAYYLVTQNESGCIGISDTLEIIVHPNPPAPVLTVNGNLLSSSPAFAYQWFFEGIPLSGETAQDHEAIVNGNYYVQISDSNGCTANSDTTFVLATGMIERTESGADLYPNPTAGSVVLSVHEPYARMTATLFDERGRAVARQEYGNGVANSPLEFDLKGIAKGIYNMRLETGVHVWNLSLVVQ